MRNATLNRSATITYSARGTGITDLDVDLYVPALLESVYGNRRWMARLGSKGGQASTAAKHLASQTNGAKGGRPKAAAAISR